jgi:hypothetical protein
MILCFTKEEYVERIRKSEEDFDGNFITQEELENHLKAGALFMKAICFH